MIFNLFSLLSVLGMFTIQRNRQIDVIRCLYHSFFNLFFVLSHCDYVHGTKCYVSFQEEVEIKLV